MGDGNSGAMIAIGNNGGSAMDGRKAVQLWQLQLMVAVAMRDNDGGSFPNGSSDFHDCTTFEASCIHNPLNFPVVDVDARSDTEFEYLPINVNCLHLELVSMIYPYMVIPIQMIP